MPDSPVTHRFYGDLAGWWPLISPPEEYEKEAAFIATLLGSAPSQSARSSSWEAAVVMTPCT